MTDTDRDTDTDRNTDRDTETHTPRDTDIHIQTEDKPAYGQTLTNMGLLAFSVSLLNPCVMAIGGRYVD